MTDRTETHPTTCDCDSCFEAYVDGAGNTSASETAAENAWLRSAEYAPEARDEMERELYLEVIR